MEGTEAARVAAGFSFLLAPGTRPGAVALARSLEAGQSGAAVVRADASAGRLEIVIKGLAFDIDGLTPADCGEFAPALDFHGFATRPDVAALEAFRLYPGPHLSGGTRLAPVLRALVVLAAELAESLPVRAVLWHPAAIAIEPQKFARSMLTWLAGGALPVPGLAALSALADGSVSSRGLAHFTGQEVTVRGRPQDVERTGRLAAKVVDRFVKTGPVQDYVQFTIGDESLCAEPTERGRRVMVWHAE